ncbi:MAG TPA: caspase family protein, partial [Rudaea sp.]|nr:caspase family protein [Rudaea sp.]
MVIETHAWPAASRAGLASSRQRREHLQAFLQGATPMIRRVLLLMAMTVVVAVSASPAIADRRVALVIGNSAYQNVARLENPRNDALLMAATLQELGFTLIGDGAQLDLDKAGLDSAVQKFGASLQGAEVGMFYYAGHGVQVRGSNYLVPVGANPTREADVDFQMVDVSLVLRQMEGAGTRLNLVVLDACRNNPFGGRGLRATDGGLAQMRAPEGTLISFATQPGNVALDGEGNSPYTKALAATIRKSGLDIFQTFNEVGLAVKRSTGGSQQPWVSSS